MQRYNLKQFYFLLTIFVLIILFFFTRLYHILTLPIFTDEALYIRWAQIAKQDANWRFISLVDGKQPSVIWFMIVTLKIFADPLFAGRIVSVITGALTTIGLFFLGKELFKSKLNLFESTWIGILSSLLYVLFPMALVYDKMAIYDSTVTMFAVWALYFEVLLVRYIRLDLALLLGMIFGGGVLTKSNGFFNIYLLPFSLLLFDFRQKQHKDRFIKWALCATIAAAFGYGYYQILRLSPYFHVIAQKNSIFVYPFSEWIHHPFTYFQSNLNALLNWFSLYLTLPIIVLIALSFVIDGLGISQKNKQLFLVEKLLLIIWFILPFTALALFGKNIYPRFIFPMVTPLLPLAAYSIVKLYTHIKNRLLYSGILLGACVLFLRADYFILQDFSHAPIPESDLGQYSNDWPAGGGVREAIALFESQAATQKIFVATQGTFGLLPHAFEIYLITNPHVQIKGYWPIKDKIPQEVLDYAKRIPTYFVFYQPCPSCPGKGLAPESWQSNLKIIKQIQKAAPDALFTVYQVKPS